MSEKSICPDRVFVESPQSLLERTLIEEYLLNKGYLRSDLSRLPPGQAKNLLREACRFASLRLAEIESRAKFHEKIRPPISLN
jgi:hypothetical protein